MRMRIIAVGVGLGGLCAVAHAASPADGPSSSSATPQAGVPAAPAAPSPTPTLADRLAALEAARGKLLTDCQTGLAQHDGAIAVLRAALGTPAAAPAP